MSPRDRKLDYIAVGQVVPNEKNPRTKGHFSKDELLSLNQSIREHGILQPILVQPYRDGPKEDRYLLIEGERRYTVAKNLGLKEIPAIIDDKRDDHDQLVTMYNVHTQFRGWEMAEKLRTIKELIERNGSKSEADLAQELGITVATFRNHVKVLEMGDDVVTDIATDRFDYSSALRASEAASSLAKRRPKLVKKLGGPDAVESQLLGKAKARGGKGKGISQELVEVKRDLSDPDVPDTVGEKYITEPKAKLPEVRREHESLAERRRTESLAQELRRTAKEIRAFDIELAAVPNLRELRTAIGQVIDAGQELEARVVDALLEKDE